MVTLIPLAALMIFAIAANLVQHRPLLSLDPITPKLSKISPVDGFRRLFSGEALVNFAKGLGKIGLVSGIMFYVLWPERDRLEQMVTADPALLLGIVQDLAVKIFGATLAVITIIAGADFFYQRNKWWQRQKMTLQETRDEYKQMEGDPHVKARIRQLRMERSRKRMMQAVPDATVIITNPTHFAVALKYDKRNGGAKVPRQGRRRRGAPHPRARRGARHPHRREPAARPRAVRQRRGRRDDPHRALQGGGAGDRLRHAAQGQARLARGVVSVVYCDLVCPKRGSVPAISL